jgi:hypothetical protein
MISSTQLVRLLQDANLQSYVVVETPAASLNFDQVVSPDLSLCRFRLIQRSASNIRGRFEVLGVSLHENFPLSGPRRVLRRTYTIEQAIHEFCRMPQQILLIGAFTIVKSLETALDATGLASKLESIRISVEVGGDRSVSDAATVTSPGFIREISRLTSSIIYVRQQLPLYVEYLERLIVGEKVTTIRFRPGAIEIPANISIPVYKTPDFGPGDRTEPAAVVSVSGISYLRYGDLDENDAARDGFQTLEAMRAALATIYSNINDDAWLTIYHITPLPRAD